LTIPVGPKFATDRRMASEVKKKEAREWFYKESSTDMFKRGLRSAKPPIQKRNQTPEPRRLTIPVAPKFATSQRLGDKTKPSTPFSSPTRKGRDDASWSSQLRDMSDINSSPLSKAASSVKTGPLTIAVEPNFQPIRKRPLPKSTAEREMEEIEHYKEHPFKARIAKLNAQASQASRSRNPTPKRKLTIPEPFSFHTIHKRDHQAPKEEVSPSFKALPMPKFSSKKPTSSAKKTPYQPRHLTIPKPFKFHSSSTKRSPRSEEGSTPNSEKFKARPMPDFKKSSQMSVGKKKLASPPTRPLTTPEPFKFHSSRKRYDVTSSEKATDAATFKARPMPIFRKTPQISPRSTNKLRSERSQRIASKSSNNRRPTGASGLLFHPSFTTSSRLSRPRVVKQPVKREKSKPFKARSMPDFIPEVIVTRTPIKSEGGEEGEVDGERPYEQEQELEQELESILSDTFGNEASNFQARPMPNFEKVDIPVKDKNPIRIRTPPKTETPESSPGFKAKPAPKNMLDEPSISVRRRDPKKLRSPASVKKTATPPSVPKSPGFRARPGPDSLYDDPIREQVSPMKSPPRIQRENQAIDDEVNNVLEDAKVRLRERLSQRRTNSAAVKAATPPRNKKKTSPKAFSTLRVQSRLNSQEAPARMDSADNLTGTSANTPRKSNSTVPKSIGLPQSTTNSKKESSPTPRIAKNSNDASKEQELAQALSIEDGDESSNILKLAQEVQRAAEDELSFYGSVEQWSGSRESPKALAADWDASAHFKHF
jgi:hypothetical protein